MIQKRLEDTESEEIEIKLPIRVLILMLPAIGETLSKAHACELPSWLSKLQAGLRFISENT